MDTASVSNIILKSLKKLPRPYIYITFPTRYKGKVDKDLYLHDIRTFDYLCETFQYDPFLFEKSMSLDTAVVIDVETRQYRERVEECLVKKASEIVSAQLIYDNYIPPPEPLFADDEIILCDQDDGKKTVRRKVMTLNNNCLSIL